MDLSLEQKVRLLTGADFWSVAAEPAIGLRRMVLSDGPAGVRGERWDEREPSANVPSPTALAASWDRDRVRAIGRLLAVEARRKGVDVLLAPTVNLHRSPYGGRHFECLSEDPLLTAEIGVAYVLGVQELGVAATVKHFVANDSETERFTVDVRVDPRALRELYLAPFEAIVRAGVWAVMAAYNGVNGSTMTESPLLHDILRAEWGFDGVVMSDWFATRETIPSALASLDLVMPGPFGPWGDDLVNEVRAGTVPQAVVDAKLANLLRLAERVGALKGGGPPLDGDGPPLDGSKPPLDGGGPPLSAGPVEDVGAQVRAAAAAGFVLARNEGALLPLDKAVLRTVAVLGPNAAAARTLGGGSATVFPPYAVSPLAGIREALEGVAEVTHRAGVRLSGRVGVAPLSLVSDAGEPGVRVRLLAEDGTELSSEHRNTGQLTWLGQWGDGVASGEVATVEVTATLTAVEGGPHVVGCSGIGTFSLACDGRTLFDGSISPDPGLAAHESLLSIPQWSTTVELRAGESADLTLRYSVPGGMDAAKLELNVEGPPPAGDDFAAAVDLARAADAVVLVVGTTEEVESEGFDRTTLVLPGDQDALVRAVLEVNPRTVVVVNSGAPVLLPWVQDAAAVLLAWFPGQEFGRALADVLFGAVEPGGRLPVTWPASEAGLLSTRPVDGVLTYAESIRIGYRRDDGPAVAFPFGHGLGYTVWDFESVDAGPDEVRVTVRNAGPRAGREVVQLYAGRPDSAVDRPRRWLVGFAAVSAGPGERRTVTIPLGRRAVAHWDVDGAAWAVEPGAFTLEAGRSVADLPLVVSSWSPAPDGR